MMEPQLRTLGLVRLSKTADPASTSIERQHEIIERKSAELGHSIIGWAEDRATSAFKIPPMERRQLRVWLTDRLDEYDAILFWRWDRVVRRVSDFVALVEWCKAHRKALISATEGIDVTQHAGYLMGIMAAWSAEGSSLDTSARVTGTKDYLRRNGRWPGGQPSYGYRKLKNTDGPGWRLEADPESSVVIRDIVRRVLAGAAVNAIVADLNRRRVPSPRDYLKIRAGGSPEQRHPWIARSVRVILRSPALLGQVIHDGQVVRGDDGMPLTWAEPLIRQGDWYALQARLNAASKTKARTQTLSYVLGVGFCGVCQSPLYKWSKPNSRGVTYSYYKCQRAYNRASQVEPCPAKPIKCERLDDVIDESIIDAYGWIEVGERKLTQSNDRDRKLAEVGAAIAQMTHDRYVRRVTVDDFAAKLARLEAEHERLSGLENEAAQVEWVPSGFTVAEHWQRTETDADRTARRLFLMSHGVKVFAHRDPDDDLLLVTIEDDGLLEMMAGLQELI